MATTAPPVPRGTVTADLNFFTSPTDGARPFNYVDSPPEGQPQRNYTSPTHSVPISDARGREDSFTLDHDAFAIVRNQPAPSSEPSSFTDDDSIRRHYYPELERLLLDNVQGATRVLFFDHTIRRARPGEKREPVLRVHIDQTPASAAQRVVRHLPDEADELLKGRYRIINVWRPLNKKPLESFPLAFASSATLEDDDFVPVEHRYSDGYVGQTAAIRHNEGQKWYYLSGMTSDERLLLECFDSEALKEGSEVLGGRLAYTAFLDPRTRADAEERESIEVRALVFGP